MFHISPGDGCANTVTLVGVTVRNGNAGIGGGGGILNSGATLNVENSTIGRAGFGNRASMVGGGIYSLRHYDGHG